MKKISLFAAAVAMMSMVAVSCSSSQSTETNEEAATEQTETADAAVTEGVVQLDADDMFTPDTKVTVPTVLDFNAVWCVPCKKLTPAFDKAAETYAGKVSFYSVDIDKNPKTAQAFNIQNVPTVVFMSPDGTVRSYVGLEPFGLDATTPADQLTETLIQGMDKKIGEMLK